MTADANKECCRRVMNKHHHHSEQCHGVTVSRCVANKDLKLRSNATRDATGVNCIPILLGKVQIGTIHNDQREILLQELRYIGVTVDKKTMISDLKKILIDDEHPDSKTDTNYKKFLLPKFLTATDWMKYNLDDALTKIFVMRERIVNDY